MKYRQTNCESGRVIVEYLDDSGIVTGESHAYHPIIGIIFNVVDGIRTNEVYVYNGKPVCAKVYEEKRQAYPDMPQASKEGGATDRLRTLLREGRKAWLSALKSHKPDYSRGRQVDQFARDLINADSSKVVKCRTEADVRRCSRGLQIEQVAVLVKLIRAGIVEIFLADQDARSSSFGSCVVRIPEGVERGKILRLVDELARTAGKEGDLDDGQEFAYVSLE